MRSRLRSRRRGANVRRCGSGWGGRVPRAEPGPPGTRHRRSAGSPSSVSIPCHRRSRRYGLARAAEERALVTEYRRKFNARTPPAGTRLFWREAPVAAAAHSGAMPPFDLRFSGTRRRAPASSAAGLGMRLGLSSAAQRSPRDPAPAGGPRGAGVAPSGDSPASRNRRAAARPAARRPNDDHVRFPPAPRPAPCYVPHIDS
jgi:hypothetical protein